MIILIDGGKVRSSRRRRGYIISVSETDKKCFIVWFLDINKSWSANSARIFYGSFSTATWFHFNLTTTDINAISHSLFRPIIFSLISIPRKYNYESRSHKKKKTKYLMSVHFGLNDLFFFFFMDVIRFFLGMIDFCKKNNSFRI